MDGHFFELWFFAKLLYGGFECFKIGVNGDTFLHDAWISTTELQYFDPNAYVPVNQSKQWLAPLSWNQGGYDASQTVEVYFVVSLRKLSTFKPNVDERQVWKEVVKVVGLEADTRVVIEVVGVKYEELCEVHDLNRLETRRVNSH
ncbi:uncharacterized protein CCR75_005708 [Bremia lactucae]|uniref:Uncharacterized protein n=1 Tax=Bremia lactucae TaxID=4779 RepID=A0A976IIR2_BRELC|nr:hypothetical protein CCR75_005708 [Bremia lactucae]